MNNTTTNNTAAAARLDLRSPERISERMIRDIDAALYGHLAFAAGDGVRLAASEDREVRPESRDAMVLGFRGYDECIDVLVRHAIIETGCDGKKPSALLWFGKPYWVSLDEIEGVIRWRGGS